MVQVELSQAYQNGRGPLTEDGLGREDAILPTPDCLMRGWRRWEGEPLCAVFPSLMARLVCSLQEGHRSSEFRRSALPPEYSTVDDSRVNE